MHNNVCLSYFRTPIYLFAWRDVWSGSMSLWFVTCAFHLLYTEKCLHVTTVFKYLDQLKRHVGMVVKPSGTMTRYC